MQVFKCASMQVFSLQVCKYASMPVCKYSIMQRRRGEKDDSLAMISIQLSKEGEEMSKRCPMQRSKAHIALHNF